MPRAHNAVMQSAKAPTPGRTTLSARRVGRLLRQQDVGTDRTQRFLDRAHIPAP
jgi:hypothetical protein